MAARAIMWAADTGRREVFVGGPTVKAILGNRLAAGLLDRYLATTEYMKPNKPANPRIATSLRVGEWLGLGLGFLFSVGRDAARGLS